VAAVATAARAEADGVAVELGGGLRTEADVVAALTVVDDAILGTAAVERPGFAAACADRYPGRIAVSLDLRAGRAALDGWSRTGADDPIAVAARVLEEGASRLIVTETSRDGTLAGPDLDALRGLRTAFPDAILVAAGGVGSLDDLRALDAIGIDGAVVGLALLSGAVDVADAVTALS
jgi:phosphoribosylformimino-5-aminoimidazole carboxamide ribotide isomerase